MRVAQKNINFCYDRTGSYCNYLLVLVYLKAFHTLLKFKHLFDDLRKNIRVVNACELADLFILRL